MKKQIFITIILIGLNAYSQEVVTDWKKLDGLTSLNEYIENQAYDYLNFKPIKKDTLNNTRENIPHRPTITKMIIRDQSIIPDKPIIFINQFPTSDQTILSQIKLLDIEKITLHKPTEQILAIYGASGKNGLIFVEMNKRKWKKLEKKIR